MPQAAESRSAPYCQKTARIVLHALDIADCRGHSMYSMCLRV